MINNSDYSSYMNKLYTEIMMIYNWFINDHIFQSLVYNNLPGGQVAAWHGRNINKVLIDA